MTWYVFYAKTPYGIHFMNPFLNGSVNVLTDKRLGADGCFAPLKIPWYLDLPDQSSGFIVVAARR
jgi:hypothetical protein